MPSDPAPDAETLALFDCGAFTVAQAAEWSGLSRGELYMLMGDGTLEWFNYGARGDRLIVAKTLQDYLASQFLAWKNAPRKPRRKIIRKESK